VPVFLAALLLVRGVPALLNLHSQGRAAVVATGLLQATSLPFIVTATQIGVQLGRITPVTAAALVFAGLLSVLIFPALSLSILRRAPAPAAPGTGPVHADEAPVAARYGSGLIAIGRARSTSSATTSAASTWQTRD
jgi:hypothetical protein